MEFAYDSVLKWMKEYFQAYNLYAQDPKTVERMSDYFAPDMQFTPYVAALGKGVKSRVDFYRILAGHPSAYEQFTPEDIIIDERRQAVVVLLKAEVFDTKTKKSLFVKRYLPYYQMALDENKTLKIKKIQFFWEELARGSLDVHEAFRGDR